MLASAPAARPPAPHTVSVPLPGPNPLRLRTRWYCYVDAVWMLCEWRALLGWWWAAVEVPLSHTHTQWSHTQSSSLLTGAQLILSLRATLARLRPLAVLPPPLTPTTATHLRTSALPPLTHFHCALPCSFHKVTDGWVAGQLTKLGAQELILWMKCTTNKAGQYRGCHWMY